jgi:hypothetical protein
VTIFKERLYKVFHEKNSVQRYLARRFLFPLLEPLGFQIVGDHFYEPIPNLKALAECYQETRLRELLHVTMDFYEVEANHIRAFCTSTNGYSISAVPKPALSIMVSDPIECLPYGIKQRLSSPRFDLP